MARELAAKGGTRAGGAGSRKSWRHRARRELVVQEGRGRQRKVAGKVPRITGGSVAGGRIREIVDVGTICYELGEGGTEDRTGEERKPDGSEVRSAQADGSGPAGWAQVYSLPTVPYSTNIYSQTRTKGCAV